MYKTSHGIVKGVLVSLLALILLCPAVAGASGELQPLSITMEGYEYPYPVAFLPLTIEGQELQIYNQKGTPIVSQYPTDIKGQAFDVLFID